MNIDGIKRALQKLARKEPLMSDEAEELLKNDYAVKYLDGTYSTTEKGDDVIKGYKVVEKVEQKVEVVDAEEFLKQKIPEPEYQVRGLMLERGITILAGYQSTFKTHTAVYLALCLANGSKLFDRFECKKCNVLYVNEEMDKSMIQKLIYAISNGCNLKTAGLKLMSFQGLKIDNREDNAKYINIIKSYDIKLVIFDTFRECFSAAENSADEITKVLTDYIRPIIENTGCSFLIIMHKGKANAGSEGRQAADLIRGSSMFRNYVDGILLVDRQRKTERVMISHEKMRGSREQDDINIIWNFEGNSIRPAALNEDELEKVLIDDCKKDLIEFAKSEGLQEINTGSGTKIYKKFIESKKYSNGTFYKALKELGLEGKIRQVKRGSYEVVDKNLKEF